jgi:hypothetical protein
MRRMINGMDQDMDQTFFLFFYFQEYDLTIICMALVEEHINVAFVHGNTR